ncbi:class I adenylate-forming enzyme family protein [Aquabacterium sp. J223]|uniref:class I adenylate-forming enzyme family protein n=1 Tax=Aquabacterium sp. J223 TaxID=2898431 RepID=UPI0021AE2968|nr:AMP-binding protein [Aquabacterium sp. J223]UUX94257.1 AMP-binding protein [Aquabacterium sp. J223]
MPLSLHDDFGSIPDLLRQHAKARPDAPALVDDGQRLSWSALDRWMDRVAVALQRDGLGAGDTVAVCAAASCAYAAVYLGAVRAGVAVAPLAPGSTPQALARMLDDCGAALLFTDAGTADGFEHSAVPQWRLDGEGPRPLSAWLAADGLQPRPVAMPPEAPFNLIYSSGTTGEPKGIVQPWSMRWRHAQRGLSWGYGPQAVTLLSTPLYSNTTLVAFFPTLAAGGCVVLMPKFEAGRWLGLAQAHRMSHTMLVPVQYRRLLAHADFDRTDLSSTVMKFCTSAPFPAELKAEVLRRWPGGLVEFYGMTEGGGSCVLEAHLHPDKLHTVGRPLANQDIRLIDGQDRELPRHPDSVGEVVGRSPSMMSGYHRRPDASREAEWFSPDGLRFIRTGDVGRFDDDGFLVLVDRRKDMIISGGFNLYPSDLESVLQSHPAVLEAAVVGLPSQRWGETPWGFVAARPGQALDGAALLAWANERLGKTQRLAGVSVVDSLPRSPIGKVLKRELKDLAPAVD